MDQTNPTDLHISDLREWRNRPAPDLSMEFIAKQFKQQIAKPHKQLCNLVGLWEDAISDELLDQTRLVSFTRGVLKVQVSNSSTLYKLDRSLRQGLETQLRENFNGTLRRVKLVTNTPGS